MGDPFRSRWGCFLPDLTRLAGGNVHHRPSAVYIDTHVSNGKNESMLRRTVHLRLDPRLEASTHPLVQRGTIHLRLVDDRRWPWVMITLANTELREIDDLSLGEMEAVMHGARDAARALRGMTGAAKTNVATLGNVVETFHLHVVARSPGDPNWPGPVWGFGEAEPYGTGEVDEFRTRFLAHLRKRA